MRPGLLLSPAGRPTGSVQEARVLGGAQGKTAIRFPTPPLRGWKKGPRPVWGWVPQGNPVPEGREHWAERWGQLGAPRSEFPTLPV